MWQCSFVGISGTFLPYFHIQYSSICILNIHKMELKNFATVFSQKISLKYIKDSYCKLQ